MRILVLGSTGQLGAELVRRSPEHGFDVKGLSREELDVTNGEAFERALATHEPHFVINTAARNAVPACEIEVEAAYIHHASSVQSMATACRARSVRFVTYSTDYVFDGEKGAPYHEGDATRPLQTYGLSKRAGEQACLLYAPETLVIRTCGVYGGRKGSRAKGGNFVLGILRQCKEKEEIEVSSEQIVNPVYAVHLADATLALLERKPAGGIYHLSSEEFCPWSDFAGAILEIEGSSARVRPVDHQGLSGSLRRPKFSALANVRAKALGVVLPHWRKGLEEYVPWLRRQGAI